MEALICLMVWVSQVLESCLDGPDASAIVHGERRNLLCRCSIYHQVTIDGSRVLTQDLNCSVLLNSKKHYRRFDSLMAVPRDRNLNTIL